MKQSRLLGLYSALVTPYNSDESIKYDVLRELVEWEIKCGVEGLYCCGSSGEGLLLSLDERKNVLDTVIKCADNRVPVIAHVGTIRTADVVDLANHAKASGAAAISMIPPYYYTYSMDEVINYYLDVAASTSDIPIIIYNIPKFTGVSFNKDNAKKLLDNPRICGIKHTCQDIYTMERLRRYYPDKCIFNGLDEQYLSAISQGAEATIATTMNIFSPLFHEIRDSYYSNDMKSAFRAQQRLNDAMEVFQHINIFSSVKYILTQIGFDCGFCRKPFAKLSDDEKAILNEKVLPMVNT